MARFKITVLCENTALDARLAAEHGLCVLVERGDDALLFDTGSSGAFLDNARLLGKDLSRVRAVALSHNHYDHTRGYLEFVKSYGVAHTLYMGWEFYRTRGWDDAEQGYFHSTSGPLSAAKLSELYADVRLLTADVTPVTGLEGASLLANIPRAVPFETVDETNLRLAGGAWVVDDYADELALALDGGDGLAVLTGCAHTGVCSIVACAEARLGKPVRAVIGGTHLVAFDADRAQRTAEWLSAKRIPTVAACHCTGPDASALFSQLGFAQAGGGYSITFGREESTPCGTAPSC